MSNADTEPRNEIFSRFAHLIPPIARRILSRLPAGAFTLADLEQEGAIGLIAGAERYDPERAGTFAIYASCRIRGAILDAIKGTPYREASVPSAETEPVCIRPSPEVIAGKRQETARLQAAVRQLPERQRKIIVLRARGATQSGAGRALGGISQAGARDLERRAIAGIQRRMAA